MDINSYAQEKKERHHKTSQFSTVVFRWEVYEIFMKTWEFPPVVFVWTILEGFFFVWRKSPRPSLCQHTCVLRFVGQEQLWVGGCLKVLHVKHHFLKSFPLERKKAWCVEEEEEVNGRRKKFTGDKLHALSHVNFKLPVMNGTRQATGAQQAFWPEALSRFSSQKVASCCCCCSLVPTLERFNFDQIRAASHTSMGTFCVLLLWSFATYAVPNL